MKNMKKMLLCCIVGASLLSFAACGTNNNKTDRNDNTNNNTEADNNTDNNASQDGDNIVDDAGDAVENTGDAIVDGVEDMGGR